MIEGVHSADWPWRPPLQRRKPELTPVVGDLLQAVSKTWCLDDMAIDAPVTFRLVAARSLTKSDGPDLQASSRTLIS